MEFSPRQMKIAGGFFRGRSNRLLVVSWTVSYSPTRHPPCVDGLPRLATRSRYPFHIAARHRSLFPGKPVANAAHGLDQVGRVSEFFTERTDVDVDRAFQGIGVFTA